MMGAYSIKKALDLRSELGESPSWSVARQALYWLDIDNHLMNGFTPETGAHQSWPLPSMPGCFAFDGDDGAIVAARDGFYRLDLETGDVRYLVAPEHDPSKMRFNDGRTDRQGRLWVGTIRADANFTDRTDNAFYRLDQNGLTRMLNSVGVANGTAFSPDGKTMYRAQTETRQVHAYDYDPETGTPSNGRVFVDIPDVYGMPDGATVDSEGGYWVALPIPRGCAPQASIARYTPDGRLDFNIEFPVPFVTMVAFGGPDMSTLYATTARLQQIMPFEIPEDSGCLYSIETPFRGLPETPFQASGR